jgi:hypothetical protein
VIIEVAISCAVTVCVVPVTQLVVNTEVVGLGVTVTTIVDPGITDSTLFA